MKSLKVTRMKGVADQSGETVEKEPLTRRPIRQPASQAAARLNRYVSGRGPR
jgi:hypothetical protein